MSDKNKSYLHEKEGINQPENTSKAAAEKIKFSRQKKYTSAKYLENILAGNLTFLSKAITLVESTSAKHQTQANEILDLCLPYANKSIRIGITGVPGVGKSTFIEALGKHFTKLEKKVAVLAVDPSSSINKGSILGDKTRMEELVLDENAFIRPSPSGTSLGGVAQKTRESILLCEAAGFDIILVETVGVGQSETAVHNMVDFFLLLKIAGAGDELQGIKRGIIEMADAIIINKADGENHKKAKIAKSEFSKALHLYPPKENGWQPKVLLASALEKTGIEAVYEMISGYISENKKSNFFENKRFKQNEHWLLSTINNQLKANFYNDKKNQQQLKEAKKAIKSGKTTPFLAAKKILENKN